MKSSKVRQILAELQRIKVLSQSHTFTLISAVFTPQSKMASETVKKSNMTDYKPRLGYRWKSNKCYLFECTCFEFCNCWRNVTENLASIFWSNFFSSSLCTPWPVNNCFLNTTNLWWLGGFVCMVKGQRKITLFELYLIIFQNLLGNRNFLQIIFT